jgi:hypothetical protein
MINVARVPTEQFEKLVERDKPATISQLAQLGTKSRASGCADLTRDQVAALQEVTWVLTVKLITLTLHCPKNGDVPESPLPRKMAA